jgi:hypothetical protein
MLTRPLSFPDHLPAEYELIEDGIDFDASTHLQLEMPERIWTLEEFGYDQASINICASPIAVTAPFRLLSDAGVDALHGVVSRLKSVSTSLEGARNPAHLAGGVYRSKFLKDFCACPQILEHMSTICGTTLAPHSMPSQQLYANYAPEDVSKAVDAWHYDGIGFDYVLMLSDPAKLKGGNFEYFQGSKFEIADMFGLKVQEVMYGITEDLPAERVIKAQFPAAGYAIFQQGNMVVHRAAKLLEPADRITLVPGLVSCDLATPDPTAKHIMPSYGEPGIVSELARHSAWLAQAKLQNFIDTASLTDNSEQIQLALQDAIADISASLEYIKNPPETYGNH